MHQDFCCKISLIIPIYNALPYVKKCLRSILQNFDFNIGEVLLVDDGSDTKTKTFLKNLKKHHKEFVFIENTQNMGYLKSCNTAFKYTKGELVVFLNSDTEIYKNFTDKILACFNSDENIAAASPIASNSASFWIPQIYPMNIMDKKINKEPPSYPEIFNAEGFCLCLRKNYIQGSPFDEIYSPGYCEEVDLCLKIRNEGKKCVLIDNLYVKHARHKSFGQQRRNKYLSINNKTLCNRWKKFFNEVPPQYKIRDKINRCFNKYEALIMFKTYALKKTGAVYFIKRAALYIILTQT